MRHYRVSLGSGTSGYLPLGFSTLQCPCSLVTVVFPEKKTAVKNNMIFSLACVISAVNAVWGRPTRRIVHFTVVCLVTLPLSESEAGVTLL